METTAFSHDLYVLYLLSFYIPGFGPRNSSGYCRVVSCDELQCQASKDVKAAVFWALFVDFALLKAG